MAIRDINPDPYGPQNRSIRNIPVAHKRQPVREEGPAPRRPRKPNRRRRLLIWAAGLVVLCVAAGVLLSTVFAGAVVHISPKTATVSPTGTIAAALNGPSNVLAYKIITTTQSATTTVAAAGTQQVSRQASGLVTISNTYSASSQRLIANTRFEAPDGKIYRIHDSVVVPGMSGSNPGTVNATIYADSPGDSYNRSDATTFTIPGFKGDPRYTGFSAQSQGPIAGGFVGSEPAVAPADLASAKTALQNQLDQTVRTAAANAIPNGYVAIPGTLNVIFGDVAQADAGQGQASVSQSATASGAVVSAADFASAIAAQTVGDYKGEAVALDPASALTVNVASTTDITKGQITMIVGGSAKLVWQFDPNAVKQALLGKPKSQFQTILASFAPAIQCTQDAPCDASIRPFWAGSFPSDPAKITVQVR